MGTTGSLGRQLPRPLQVQSYLGEVILHHAPHQTFEADRRPPSELSHNLRWVARRSCTSVGLKYRASTSTNGSQSSPTCAKASSHNSRTVWPSPVPMT